MDVHCKCGHHGHIDTDFFYFYECPKCHTRYGVGPYVRLVELTKEEAQWVETRGNGFTQEEPEDVH
jgi:hypothetical protein